MCPSRESERQSTDYGTYNISNSYPYHYYKRGRCGRRMAADRRTS